MPVLSQNNENRRHERTAWRTQRSLLQASTPSTLHLRFLSTTTHQPSPSGTAASLAASLAASQLKGASEHGISRSLPLPCSLCRPLPKGAIGIQRTKASHDNGNSSLIPGIWTSLLGGEAAVLCFIGRHFNVCFRTTTFRLCWFMGWIPHKTKVLEEPAIRSKGVMSVVERIHHSAFSKPEIEHLAFSSMNPACMHGSADSHSHS
jgi:hypothetical protein